MSFWPEEGAVGDAQDLEDLATASWLSQTLFAALELDVFEALGEGAHSLRELARRCAIDEAGCERLVAALASLGLLVTHAPGTPDHRTARGLDADPGGRLPLDVTVACSTVARRHLLRAAPGYLGHSLAYRSQLSGNWERLADAVRRGGSPLEPGADSGAADYRLRVRRYLEAMDDVARHKAGLIADRLGLGTISNPILVDLGGGGGAVAAAVLAREPAWRAVVVDMPEVVAAAEELWQERESALRGRGESQSGLSSVYPSRLSFRGLDLLREPVPAPLDGASGWGLIMVSNVVHAYAEHDAGSLLERAAASLAADGLLVVHDFFTEGPGRGPVKSALFDLHMMINTYEGRTYPWSWVRDRMEASGLEVAGPVPLGRGRRAEDTALMVGARTSTALNAVRRSRGEVLDGIARELGFRRTSPIAPEAVQTAPWVEVKCRFGCGNHGRGANCPPHSPRAVETRELLASYSRALLVRGEPPTAAFHRRMLELERAAFLSGSHRALAFTAGPCRLCEECDPDDCRRPAEARPSMEASGIDVYATAAAAGWRLEPVPDAESPAVYVGLLLVE